MPKSVLTSAGRNWAGQPTRFWLRPSSHTFAEKMNMIKNAAAGQVKGMVMGKATDAASKSEQGQAAKAQAGAAATGALGGVGSLIQGTEQKKQLDAAGSAGTFMTQSS